MAICLCPGCGRTLQVRDDLEGQTERCPQCNRPVSVPLQPPELTQGLTTLTQATGLGATPLPVANPETLSFLAPPQEPGEMGRLGEYRVLKVLGAGGMGMVLQAEDPMLQRVVALKVIRPELSANPDLRARFLREARATAAIEHAHIVPIFRVGEDRGLVFMAMPFLKGEPLDARLKREKRLTVAQTVRLGRQAALGLAAAHARGLIHRDIKPANLWLEPHDGERGGPDWIKILDFGLARPTTEDDQHLTAAGAILGTPAYMAPEQASGQTVDARSDLFSLGAVLYEMVAGERPFRGTDTFALLLAVTREKPRPIRELNPAVPEPLARLIERMLAKAPGDRPASARIVADELANLEVEERTQVLSRPSLLHQKPPRKTAGVVVPVVFGGLVVVALVVAGVLFWRPPFLTAEKPAASTSAAPATHPTPASTETPPLPIKYWTNSIGMKLAPVRKGRVILGRGESQHEVDIPEPFHIGAYEVTVGQFQQFADDPKTKYKTDAERLGGTPINSKEEADPAITWRNPGFALPQTPQHPVVCMSWNDAVAFCKWLSKKEGRDYGLPTDAEWEYASRAGPRMLLTNDEVREMAWLKTNSDGQTHPVGQLKPNAWGLYDMFGNACEWVADVKEFKDTKYTRVARGGSWPFDLHTTFMAGTAGRRTYSGFRVVLRGSVE